MTSETEVLKTNEFLRRRKLRIQQVREQSKEIAKRVRQRAKVEKIYQIGAIDAKKEKEYFQHQDKLVKRLGQLYTKGLQNVGSGHQNAAIVNLQGSPEKQDLSKQRGRDATAELRRKKQEKLDEQNKLLDRKLLARAAANEISREKSTNVANKLITKPLSDDTEGQCDKPDNPIETAVEHEKPEALRSDMATQWDFEQVPSEWEPNVPELNLPKEDSPKCSPKRDKSDRSKKINLFAVSDEMPSSLRGGLTSVPERPETSVPKPSVTLISEYLQNRDLRLRESDVSFKKKSDDLLGIKQTIQRTRASKNEAKSQRESDIDCALNRKESVMIYNHSTRDTRDIPFRTKQYVSRDLRQEEDAYSQAMRESSIDNEKEREHQKKLQEMRNKIAMTKQTVEKEYKDTMAFLNTYPKDKSKPIKNAYMDEQRQQMLKESRQRKMQYEFKQIQKECKKNAHKRPSKSPVQQESDNDFNEQDFQYSWMPVPDSDSNFAIHTIPTTLKEGKSGNAVKFSKVDSYHEYRSRHKHTPPTKDTGCENRTNNDTDDDSSESSITSDSSAAENLQLNTQAKTGKGVKEKYSDAERIIIYKILDSKSKSGKDKVNSKLLSDIAKSLTTLDKEKFGESEPSTSGVRPRNVKRIRNAATRVSFEQLNEGVYRAVNNNNGMSYNVMSCYTTNLELWNATCSRPWWENITALHLADSPREDFDEGTSNACTCGRKDGHGMDRDAGSTSNLDGDNISKKGGPAVQKKESMCPRHGKKVHNKQSNSNPVEVADDSSATSFKTARNEKVMLSENDFVKLIDDGSVNSGKFYIGASGVLKNDNYEVVIHLRKKDQDVPKEAAKEMCDRPTSPNVSKSADSKQDAPVSVAINTDPEAKSTTHDAISISSETQSSSDPQYVANEAISNTNTQNVHHVTVSSDKNDNESPKEVQRKDFVEKVDKPTQRGYVDGIRLTREDSAPRTGVSACTQTTLGSPDTRRPLYHMSSSTSTAYMSPPDMIIPPYLKYARKEENTRGRKEATECVDRETLCDQYVSCGCERCTHARKIVVNKIRPALATYDKVKKSYKIWQPPPNTVRSSTSELDYDIFDFCSNVRTPSISSSHTKRKPRKRQGDCGSKHCLKNHLHTRHSSADNKRRPSRNFMTKVPSNVKSSSKTNIQWEKNANKMNINPVVKTYIDRLLQLNKTGMKTVDILNQDCSEITTPGSSVINVSRNTVGKPVENKISLKDIKDKLTQQIIDDCIRERNQYRKADNNSSKTIPRFPKKKSLHKVKSLNISKHLLKPTLDYSFKSNSSKPCPKSPIKRHDCLNVLKPTPIKPKARSRSSPSPRRTTIVVPVEARKTKPKTQLRLDDEVASAFKRPPSKRRPDPIFNLPGMISSESDAGLRKKDIDLLNSSTQTQHGTDEEIHFMKLAVDKIQNMEKIADLTEKCTKRLSNLAKVLEEVRKNKSAVYSQISDSDSDRRSDKNIQQIPDTLEAPDSNRSKDANQRPHDDIFRISKSDSDKDAIAESSEPRFIITHDSDSFDRNTSPFSYVDRNIISKSENEPNKLQDTVIEPITESDNITKALKESDDKRHTGKTVSRSKPHLTISSENISQRHSPSPSKFMDDQTSSSTCDLFLKDIPKPDSTTRQDIKHVESVGSLKQRGRPPPALSRVHLKHAEDLVPPHELSTVVEVDSPLSVKMKSARNNRSRSSDPGAPADDQTNPDLLQILTKAQMRTSLTDSSDDSKMQMMDLKKFNDIMLQPFMSIQEYAKQCNIEPPEEVSNMEDATKPEAPHEEVSSARSDSSLPDVISELLKRKIISEPFKFDTTSTANSTTVSSDSTSALALSKARKDKKKSSIIAHNKENLVDTSDTLSISSNPDLEHAFKKLGMGWASSTLKKTKERLALSSSSNTSSSSLAQFKIKSFSNNDIPLVVSDSVSSALNLPRKSVHQKISDDSSKNVEQQTSKINSMTVKEFLTTELAKKITFNKSYRDDSEEFVSLYETKMPEQMKHSSLMAREPSLGSQRARTSTPVQLFKSLTYHSTSSSNVSGIFSNADELSSVKGTSNSVRNNSTSDKDDLTIPNYSLRMRKGFSDWSKSE